MVLKKQPAVDLFRMNTLRGTKNLFKPINSMKSTAILLVWEIPTLNLPIQACLKAKITVSSGLLDNFKPTTLVSRVKNPGQSFRTITHNTCYSQVCLIGP